MSALSGFFAGLFYRGREGHLSFIGHRLAGLGTVLFLGIHILDTATFYFIPSLYVHAIELYRSTLFMFGEILLVAAVIFHGINGLKIILNDTFPHWWSKSDERSGFWRIAALTLVLWAPAAFMMGRNLYLNNFCRCAPESTVDAVALSNFSLVSIPVAMVIIIAVLVFGASTHRLATPRGVSVPGHTLETWSWLFMRWSGSLLIPLVWIHVLIQDVLVGVHAIDIDFVALRWALVGWRVYDIALLGFAFGHGMNGLRHVANDYITSPRASRVVNGLIFVGW